MNTDEKYEEIVGIQIKFSEHPLTIQKLALDRLIDTLLRRLQRTVKLPLPCEVSLFTLEDFREAAKRGEEVERPMVELVE